MDERPKKKYPSLRRLRRAIVGRYMNLPPEIRNETERVIDRGRNVEQRIEQTRLGGTRSFLARHREAGRARVMESLRRRRKDFLYGVKKKVEK